MARGIRLSTAFCLGALLVGAAVAQQATSDLAAVKARGKLTVLSFPHQDSEFMSVNLERGPMRKLGGVEDFRGLDVDIMAGFASALGVTLEIRPVATPGYGELIPELLAGHGDVVASSFSITSERLKQVDFSTPYFESRELVVLRQDAKLATAADLKGRKGAAVRGSSQVELMRGLCVAEADLVLAEFTRDNYQAVADGHADFTVVDGGSPDLVLGDFPGLKTAFPVGDGMRYGFAVRKGSDLLPFLDRHIKKLQASGKLEELRLKWVNAAKK
jgi:ABC-type amino acid transport substrate-binding protein